MKILLSTLSFLMGIQFIHAQTYEIGFDAEVLKNYSVFKKGNVVHIDSMKHEIAFSEFDNTHNTHIHYLQVLVVSKLKKSWRIYLV